MMYKTSLILIVISIIILSAGLLFFETNTILVTKTQKQLFLTDSLDSSITSSSKGYIIFTVDSTVCSVCLTNIHDYVRLCKSNYPQYQILYLFNTKVSSKDIQIFYSMLGLDDNPVVYFNTALNNIKHRRIFFTNQDLMVRGKRLIPSNAVPGLEIKKEILEKGVSLISN